MSSFLCFICHSTVNSDSNEETREKYRELVGMNLCPDSDLCHICCHVLNKLWLFRSVCLKRSMEYPVLCSERGTLNLQRNDLEIHTVCMEDACTQGYHNRNINSKTYYFNCNYDNHQEYPIDNQYVKLEEDRNEFEDHFGKEKSIFESREVQTDLLDFEGYTPAPQKYTDYTDLHTEHHTDQDIGNHDTINNDFDDGKDITNVNSDLDTNTDFNETNAPTTDTNVNEPTNECYEDVNIENNEQDFEIAEDAVKKKRKSRKRKKKEFEKIVLSMEEQKAELEARRKEKKYIEAEFKCFNCALGFLFKDTYQAHMMRHEESNGEYRCATCTLRFASPPVLRKHVALHAERRRCTRCGRTLRLGARHTHAKRCWGDRDVAACHLCAAMFQDANGLQQHLKRFHQSKTSNRSYSCSVCGKSYNNQAAVRTHMIKHINRKFNCDQCQSTFSSPYTLKQHKKKHDTTDAKQHYCSMCQVGYSSRKSLLAHKRNALNHQQTIFECPICSRMCPTQRSLASHIQSVHSTTKNYECPSCPARYSTRKSLVRHIGTHAGKHGGKRAVCHLCGANFEGNNKLNRHLKEVCEKAKLEEEFANLYDEELLGL